jgi:hypothetical protein
LNTTDREPGIVPPAIVTIEAMLEVPEQTPPVTVGKTRYVTDPEGWKAVPPVKLAESLVVPPTVIELDAGVVVIAGLAFVIVRVKGVVDCDVEWVESPP